MCMKSGKSGLNNRMFGFMVLMGFGLALCGGCVSYTNVPEPSTAPAFKHANSGSSIKTIVASVERVVNRHPMRDASGRYAVNLPAGTTPKTAQTIVSRLPVGAMVPTFDMDSSVPVYHISRVWLRGSSGKVDVVYPLSDGLDGGVTVWLHGGDQPWYVKRTQYWAPGTIPTPPVYVPVGSGGFEGGSNEYMDSENEEFVEPAIELRDTEYFESGEPVENPNVTTPPASGGNEALYREIFD